MFKTLNFGKPKTPGYGISRNFYLTVLAAKAQLPPIASLINPTGDDGALKGFGVPLIDSACKELLSRPMERGTYAVATVDRKTVLRCLVISKEEAGFDPEAFVRSVESLEVDSELVARIRATWTLIQIAFEAHDPMVAPSLDFLTRFAQRVAQFTDGAIADPISRRYLLPHQVPITDDPAVVLVDAHISVRHVTSGQFVSAHTLGMQKFGLPEIELSLIEDRDVGLAEAFLLSVGQTVLNGKPLGLGDRLGAKNSMFTVCEGGLDKARWEGIICYELLPTTEMSVSSCLHAWHDSKV